MKVRSLFRIFFLPIVFAFLFKNGEGSLFLLDPGGSLFTKAPSFDGTPEPPFPRSFHPSSLYPFTLGNPPKTTGTLRIVVVLVQFADRPPSSDRTDKREYFQDLFFGGRSYPFPSLKDYFYEQSFGSLTITGEVLPYFPLSGTQMSYACYREGTVDCNNACNGLGAKSSPGFSDVSLGGAKKMGEEALSYWVTQGVDLNSLDNNNDGVVDGVVFVHTGRGAEMTRECTDLWSHTFQDSFSLPTGTKTIRYLVSSERFFWPRNGKEYPSGIGVIAHEFGHILGLPDLYDLDPQGGYGVGYYSLMGWGLYRWDKDPSPSDTFGNDTLPMAMDPWSQHRLLWLTPTTVRKENRCDFSLYGMETTYPPESKVAVLPLFDRQNLYVQYIRGVGYREPIGRSGVLIWLTDDGMEALSPQGNKNACIPEERDCSQSHYWVSLLQADGLYDLEKRVNRGEPGDLFSAGTCLTRSSRPSSKDWMGVDRGVQVCVAEMNDLFARVHLAGDSFSLPPSPVVLSKPPSKAVVGKEYRYLLKTTPSDLKVTLLSAPAGMKYRNDTKEVFWVPSEEGIYQVRIGLENCTGFVLHEFRIQVVRSEETVKKGCGCSLHPSPSSHLPFLLFMVFVFLWFRRTKRRF